jgi:hypothetical protein
MIQQATKERPETNHKDALQAVSRCPMHSHSEEQVVDLKASDELFLPRHKRVITQYQTDETGFTELYLYYEDKEISFDEPELFAFGEHLGQQSRFVAETATTWGDGYSWTRVKGLLEVLIREGILHFAGIVEPTLVAGEACQGRLPPALSQEPRTWHDCEAITAELTGRSIELGYLESVLPVYRVAHVALDMEGRQVGEANVFPKPLRLDIPTEWRTCLYPGSRYQSELPMNVTALKSMRQHWPQMMAILSKIREAYLCRFPEVRQGWTVGHLECLSIMVLALPAYMLMRSNNGVSNGSLHPVLSNMFRVTDGLRGMTHQMLTSPLLEATLPSATPITSSQIYEYTERNYGFQSAYGVCAGPKVMVEEFLAVLVDGKIIEGMLTVKLDLEVQDAVEVIEQALDYGLYGLHVYSIIFSNWSLMGRTYEQLDAILERWPENNSTAFNKFKQVIQVDIKNIQAQTVLATEEWRSSRDRVQAYLYEKTSLGLKLPSAEQTLGQCLLPVPSGHHAVAKKTLRSALKQSLGETVSDDDPIFHDLIECLSNHLCREQAMINAACAAQDTINQILGRSAPKRAFTSADMNIYNVLLGFTQRFPHLSEIFADVFNLSVVVTKNNIEISDRIAG